ncbi:MAG: cyclic nucleotide-binding domain-containing protein [Candidatus Rokubacteria bacterium]|nr:cyclic nucleotide-binding domain-containing protein [Candidatus Rokubacteria bacterium]
MTPHQFIVDRNRPEVYAALRQQLAAVEDVAVILDRRRRDRRQDARAPKFERRRADRRSRPVEADLTSVGFAVASRPRSPRKDLGEAAPRAGSDAASFLAGVALFEEFTRSELTGLAGRLRERTLKRGQALFLEGEPGEEMFLVRRGTIVISKAVTGSVENVLARMEPGDFFGEMSLFGRLPRSATVRAESDAILFALDRNALEHLIDTNPRGAVAFFTAMVQEFIDRLRRTNDLVAEVTRWGLEATGFDVESQ